MFEKRYAVYAKRQKADKFWREWCAVKTVDLAFKHFSKIHELGGIGKIVDTRTYKIIAQD